MKKLIILTMSLILTIFTFTLSGCGNMSFSLGNYNFRKVHISTPGGFDKCCELDNWYDNERGCEVKLKNGSSIYLSEGTYILVEDYCPICGD